MYIFKIERCNETMKKTKHFFILGILLPLFFTSCSKPDISTSSDIGSTSSNSSVIEDVYAKQNGFEFTLIDGKKEFCIDYIGDKSVQTLTVPKDYNDIPVTEIKEHAFADMENLATVYLPSSIKEIKDKAFFNCRALSKVYYGDLLSNIVVINQYTYSDNDIVFGENVFTNSYLPVVHFDSNNNQGDVYVSSERVSNEFDYLNYHIEMNDESPFKVDGVLQLDQIKDNKKVHIEIGAHGKYKKSYIELVKGTDTKKVIMPNFGIYAQHYNVAFLSATYPTTIFALKAHTITDNGNIPTYVYLERSAAFNWDNLQYNIRPLPNVARSKAIQNHYSVAVELMNDYIKDLYDINPDSKISFYVTDLSSDMIYKFFVANRIYEWQYNIIMLSDGRGSADILVGEYAVDNPSQQHKKLYDSLKAVRDYIWEKGEFDLEYIKKNLYLCNYSSGSTINYPCFFFANHMYTALNLFSNCEWWVNRFRTGENLSAITAKDTDFANSIVNNPKLVNNIYANSLLAALNDEQEEKFKILFHYDNEDFNISRENNKKIMVFLGSSWTGEQNSLYSYMKATMDFYGDEFDYYYKPHPGWPTSTCTERNQIFDTLKQEGYSFIEIDGAVAAEIIMYFNKDIYLCGYSSTTYASLDETNRGMGQMEWGVPMPKIVTDTDHAYKPYMYNYMTSLSPSSELGTSLGLDRSKTYFLVEYNDYDDTGVSFPAGRDDPTMLSEYQKHNIAIYCLEDGIIKYYKDGTAVNKDGSAIV